MVYILNCYRLPINLYGFIFLKLMPASRLHPETTSVTDEITTKAYHPSCTSAARLTWPRLWGHEDRPFLCPIRAPVWLDLVAAAIVMAAVASSGSRPKVRPSYQLDPVPLISRTLDLHPFAWLLHSYARSWRHSVSWHFVVNFSFFSLAPYIVKIDGKWLCPGVGLVHRVLWGGAGGDITAGHWPIRGNSGQAKRTNKDTGQIRGEQRSEKTIWYRSSSRGFDIERIRKFKGKFERGPTGRRSQHTVNSAREILHMLN